MCVGKRSDLRQSAADDRLHHAGCVPVRSDRGLGSAGRRLFLLHNALNYRLRRLRARLKSRPVPVAEDGRLHAVPRLRHGTDGNVLQPDAGRSDEQDPSARTTPRIG